ncbi:MAG: sugar phosphate isomerase/epimerase [Clostridiaceae bacterium]|nr:sugar phosphate isomerase/epimerase [Clostridiaceae bacterium]
MTRFFLSGFADEAAVELDRQIAVLKQNDMRYVELRQIDGKNIGSLTDGEARSAAAKLSDSGIGVSCLGSPLGKTRLDEPFEPVAEMVKRLCGHARTLDTTLIRIFSFYLPQGQSAADCRGEVVDRLGRMLDLAAQEGVTLLHENEKDIYGDTLERCLDLFEALDGKLKGILDPANFLQVGTDPLEAMRQLLPWIEYVHIKDVRLKDRRVVPAGAGDGHIADILALMNGKGGDRFLSVEPHLTLFAGREKLEKDSGPVLSASDEFVFADGPAAFAAAVAAIRQLAAPYLA